MSNEQILNSLIAGQKAKKPYDSESGRMMTKNFEGWRSKPYQDPGGKNKSIGWGFNMSNPMIASMLTPEVMADGELSKEEAQPIFDKLYVNAVKEATSFVGQDTFDKLSEGQKNVLVDMAYNMGVQRLSKFKGMQGALQSGNYPRAGAELKYNNPDAELPQETPYFKATGRRGRNNYLQILGD